MVLFQESDIVIYFYLPGWGAQAIQNRNGYNQDHYREQRDEKVAFLHEITYINFIIDEKKGVVKGIGRVGVFCRN